MTKEEEDEDRAPRDSGSRVGDGSRPGGRRSLAGRLDQAPRSSEVSGHPAGGLFVFGTRLSLERDLARKGSKRICYLALKRNFKWHLGCDGGSLP